MKKMKTFLFFIGKVLEKELIRQLSLYSYLSSNKKIDFTKKIVKKMKQN